MSYRFEDATAFNQNLGNWTLNANINLTGMLNSSGMNCTNYSATLAAWAAKPSLPTGRTLGASGRNYGTNAVAARTTLTTPTASGGKGWTISGDAASGVACSNVVLPVELLLFEGKNTEGVFDVGFLILTVRYKSKTKAFPKTERLLTVA